MGIRDLVTDQDGQALVEFSLVFYLYLAIVFMLIVHGLWLYNNFQAERAARHGAVYLGTTNNPAQAQLIARDYLGRTQVVSSTRDVRVFWAGDVPVCRVEIEMTTFFPGIPLLFNRDNPAWSDKISIVKEAVATGEHKYTHSHEYN